MNHVSYNFGMFRLFPESERLFAGPIEIALGHRAVRVLALLLERHGSIAKHQDLISHAWPESVVADNNLRVQITAIRKVLREYDPQAAACIKNISGRGYRFLIDPSNEPAPHHRPVESAEKPVGLIAVSKDQSTGRVQVQAKTTHFRRRTASGMNAVREGHIGQAGRCLIHTGELRWTNRRLRVTAPGDRSVRPINRL